MHCKSSDYSFHSVKRFGSFSNSFQWIKYWSILCNLRDFVKLIALCQAPRLERSTDNDSTPPPPYLHQPQIDPPPCPKSIRCLASAMTCDTQQNWLAHLIELCLSFYLSRYQIMEACWNERASERPTFGQLRQTLEQMLQKDVPYLELSQINNESMNYYSILDVNNHAELTDVE